MAENFLKLMTSTKPRIKESQRTPNRINTPQTYTKACHIQTGKLKINKILKEAERENTLSIKK